MQHFRLSIHRNKSIVLMGLFLCLVSVPSARAQCVYTELASDVPHPFSPATGTDYFRFAQSKTSWMAIAVRPTAGFTPQILIYQFADSYPACVAGLLEADEQAEGVSVVVGNFNRQPTGTYYGALDEVQAPSWVPVEWDAGNGRLAINDSMITRVMDANDVVDIWDVYLEAGTEYGFQVTAVSGDSLTLLLFDDSDLGFNWGGRSTAVLDAQMTGPLVRYTPVNSGEFAAVVIKESIEAATYGVAVGACVPPTPILSGVAVHPYGYQNYYQFDQQSWGWAALGMRLDGSISDLMVYAPSAGREYPTCYTNYLVNAAGGYASATARYFPSNPSPLPGVHYVRASPALGSEDPYLEWEGEAATLTVNGTPVSRDTGPSDVLEVWGVDLLAGEEYTFQLDRVGHAYPIAILFGPNETDWQAPWDALEQSSEPFSYTAAETGSHGVVVMNTSGEFGSYKLGVSTCGQPQSVYPTPTTYLIPSVQASGRFSFQQVTPRWAGVAINSEANWDVELYEHASGSADPVCFSGLLAASAEANTVDFVVADFNRNPLGTYFAYARYADGTAADAHFQWAAGWGDLVPENHMFKQLSPPSALDLFDAPMIAGYEYHIYFERISGPDDLRLFVFEPSGDTYWARRGEHVMESTSSTAFTPAITGSYGFAVINEGSSSVTYEIGISSQTVSAQPGKTRVGIHSLIPNPTTGSISIEFGTSIAQSVSFEIIDVAGRVIARLPATAQGAGTWTETWNGLSSTGNRPPNGVYFVRMKNGDSVIDLEKFVLLD